MIKNNIKSYQYIEYSYFFSGAGGFTDCIIKKWKIMLENNNLNKPLGTVRFGDEDDAIYMNDNNLSEVDAGIILSLNSINNLFMILSEWPKGLKTSRSSAPGCSIQEKIILFGDTNLELGFDKQRRNIFNDWCKNNNLSMG